MFEFVEFFPLFSVNLIYDYGPSLLARAALIIYVLDFRLHFFVAINYFLYIYIGIVKIRAWLFSRPVD